MIFNTQYLLIKLQILYIMLIRIRVIISKFKITLKMFWGLQKNVTSAACGLRVDDACTTSRSYNFDFKFNKIVPTTYANMTYK